MIPISQTELAAKITSIVLAGVVIFTYYKVIVVEDERLVKANNFIFNIIKERERKVTNNVELGIIRFVVARFTFGYYFTYKRISMRQIYRINTFLSLK